MSKARDKPEFFGNINMPFMSIVQNEIRYLHV